MSDSIYNIITERIMAALEQGTVPWRKPWSVTGGIPRNLVTGYPYRGVNPFMLNLAGFDSPCWLTYRQATSLGANVRGGEKGMPVIFWKWIEARDCEASTDRDRIPFLRYYTVFNVAQCEGISAPVIPGAAPSHQRADTIIDNMHHKPEIVHGYAGACYSPRFDQIRMPPKANFESEDRYYSTLFHELCHATGHESRLSRPGITAKIDFGSHEYSREELVAEMGASFLCAHCGLNPNLANDTAAYVASWLKALQDDKRLVIQAAAQAQKACDFILNTKLGETETGS